MHISSINKQHLVQVHLKLRAIVDVLKEYNRQGPDWGLTARIYLDEALPNSAGAEALLMGGAMDVLKEVIQWVTGIDAPLSQDPGILYGWWAYSGNPDDPIHWEDEIGKTSFDGAYGMAGISLLQWYLNAIENMVNDSTILKGCAFMFLCGTVYPLSQVVENSFFINMAGPFGETITNINR